LVFPESFMAFPDFPGKLSIKAAKRCLVDWRKKMNSLPQR
jgi:hypothetical protein